MKESVIHYLKMYWVCMKKVKGTDTSKWKSIAGNLVLTTELKT